MCRFNLNWYGNWFGHTDANNQIEIYKAYKIGC